MTRKLLIIAALFTAACGASTNPASPTSAVANDASVLGPGNSTLKATAPAPVSPINNVTITGLTPTLSVTASTLTYGTATLQYRFRIMDPTGTITADSGLQNSTSWVVPSQLTPTTTYTWMARAETRGLVGPWSTTGKFTTFVAPGNDYGAWESTCQGRTGESLVVCVWNFVRPTNSVEDFEVTKRVAWLLRASGGGLLLKSSGENVVPWMGVNYSASRICFPNGHIFKIFSDAGPGGANAPIYSDNDFVEVSLYVAAIDPRLR